MYLYRALIQLRFVSVFIYIYIFKNWFMISVTASGFNSFAKANFHSALSLGELLRAATFFAPIFVQSCDQYFFLFLVAML